jgi:hypothetical protein
MTTRVGAEIVDVLEWAGSRYLRANDPDLYRAYLLHVSWSDTLRRYDQSEVYWQRVQAILDTFFTSPERAEICAQLVDQAALRRRPEFRGFLTRAVAERRMQGLIAAATIAHSASLQASRRPL